MSDAHMKLAPTLADAGSRLRAELMEEFISNPASTHHGTTMPDMLGAETDQSRKKIAAVITAFLFSFKGILADPPSGEIDPYYGKEAFHSIGCVACHSPRDEALREVIKEGVMPLTHLARKYQPHALASFLHASLALKPSGGMQDMKLTKEEAAEIAAYLEGETKTENPPPATAEDIAAGKRAFSAYNCTACHQPKKSTATQQ